MQIGIFNAETGEQIVRDATPEEIEAREIEVNAYLANEELKMQAAAAKAAQKAALLDRLGITEDEAKLLLA
jgi:hypothetical protein